MNEDNKRELFALVLAHLDRVGRELTEHLIGCAHDGCPDGQLVTTENLHLFRQYRNSISPDEGRMVEDAIASAMKTVKTCSTCGSTAVYFDAYVGVNDPEDVRTFDQAFCDDCGGETSLVEVTV